MKDKTKYYMKQQGNICGWIPDVIGFILTGIFLLFVCLYLAIRSLFVRE